MEEQKRKRRNYPDEFKAEAVALVDRGDRSLVQVAKDLGVHPTVLRAWKRKARVEASGVGAERTIQFDDAPRGHQYILPRLTQVCNSV